MEFLYSNYPPLKTKYESFEKKFSDLIQQSTELQIGVGYVTEESIAQLKRVVELNQKLKQITLIIGMHYIDHFTRPLYEATMDFNSYLKGNNRGKVLLVKPFRFHGKMYVYSDNTGPFEGIIGSNNLSSILRNTAYKTYEAAVCLNDRNEAKKMNEFLNCLCQKCECIDSVHIDQFNEPQSRLMGNSSATFLSRYKWAEWKNKCTSVSFEIPIKTSGSSNLNAYFGKGRQNPKTGIVRPRQWYECEIIVPKKIRDRKGFPQHTKNSSGEFTVITDDGWQFECNVTGGDKNDINKNKNLRSKGDLELLGKWLKGRLENCGALKVGEPVTDEVLESYGRKTFTMTKLSEEGYWYFDFHVGDDE